MKVKDLIASLIKYPPDAEVYHVWDGEARTKIQLTWLSRGGDVITSDFSQVLYSTKERPVNAPTAEEDRHWMTIHNPICEYCGSPNKKEEDCCTNRECFNYWE